MKRLKGLVLILVLTGCRHFSPGAVEVVEECKRACEHGGLVVSAVGIRDNTDAYCECKLREGRSEGGYR